MGTHTTPQKPSPKESPSIAEYEKAPGRSSGGKGVTQARARAQRAKLDAQAQARMEVELELDRSSSGEKQQEGHARNRKKVTLERAIQDYLDDHEGGNHSDKTIEWHTTALGLLRRFLEQERGITQEG